MKKALLLLSFLCVLTSYIGCSQPGNRTEEVLSLIKKVNDRWQETHPDPGNTFWHPAAYHIGNLAAYESTGEQRYLDYSVAWADCNQWKGAKSDDPTQWKYSYGERDEYVLFGDWQTCFLVYIDIYNMEGGKYPGKIARAMEVMEYQMSTPNNDYWWWADGLFMAMPVMSKLYVVTGNDLYLEKLYDYFDYARDLMFDEEAGLFYRDARYVYPQHSTRDGIKDFWARGDGWVFAALAKVLTDIPQDAPHREEYIRVYEKMAKVIASCQQPEGYWTRSMLDPEQAPGPETSGTAFFAYGFLRDVNNGYLDREEYAPVIGKAWKYLADFTVQEDGTLGYVQPIGDRAIPGQVIDAGSTADFGVGAFLMAASEMLKYN